MQIGPEGFFHLTYCTKVHPGHGWEDLMTNLHSYVPALKARLAPQHAFGLGLRLSYAESVELLNGNRLAEFKDFLDHHNLYVFTLNGFPYGDLTGPTVKSGIFAPDWREEARVRYTLDLIEILRRLLPAGVEGSISTIPLSYKAWIAPADMEAWARMTCNLVRVTARLAQIKAEEGKLIHLDLEPEPDGLLEQSADVADYFRDWLLVGGAHLLAEKMQIDVPSARRLLLSHLQVCLDTCHLAVAYEDPVTALDNLAEYGIGVGKVQVTAGLKVELPQEKGPREALTRQLEPFACSPYLHQVIGRDNGGRGIRFPDLAPALPHLAQDDGCHWRIHYHMPLYVEQYQRLSSTCDETRAVLSLLKDQGFSRHLEIETYTWEWLPPDLKVDLLDSLHREYLWVLDAMAP
ncbi:MAG: metabolite traffic protein EboE [Desulfobaccales bacterium]